MLLCGSFVHSELTAPIHFTHFKWKKRDQDVLHPKSFGKKLVRAVLLRPMCILNAHKIAWLFLTHAINFGQNTELG